MRASFSIIAAATLTTLGVVGTAQADSIYFTYTDGTGLFATLALQISELSPGTWLATSGTMDVTTAGGAIQAGVYSVFAKPSADAHRATSPDGLFWYDNLVFPCASLTNLSQDE